MFMGIMVLAFPISVFATNFTEEWRIWMHDKAVALEKKNGGSIIMKLPQPEVIRKVELLNVEIKELANVVAENTQKLQEKQAELAQLINILRINNPVAAETEE